jgi:hypothetical protein
MVAIISEAVCCTSARLSSCTAEQDYKKAHEKLGRRLAGAVGIEPGSRIENM